MAAAVAGKFGAKVKQLMTYTWENKGEIILVGLAGSSICVGWSFLLAPLTVFRNSNWKLFYNPPNRPSDSTLSCQRQGGNLVWHFLREYVVIAPGIVCFFVAFNGGSSSAGKRLLVPVRSPTLILGSKILKSLGLAFLPISLFSTRPASLVLNRVSEDEFNGMQELKGLGQQHSDSSDSSNVSELSSNASQDKPSNSMSNYRQFGHGIFRISRNPEHITPCLLALSTFLQTGTWGSLCFFGLFPIYASLKSRYQDQQDISRIDPVYFDHTGNIPFEAIAKGKNSLYRAISEIEPYKWTISAVLAITPFLITSAI